MAFIVLCVLAFISFFAGRSYLKKNSAVKEWSINKKQALAIAWSVGIGLLLYVVLMMGGLQDSLLKTSVMNAIFLGFCFYIGLNRKEKARN